MDACVLPKNALHYNQLNRKPDACRRECRLLIFRRIYEKENRAECCGSAADGETAGAGAAGFLKKNWKWLVPVACVAVLGGVWLLKPKADKPASVDTSYVETAPEQRDLVNALSGTGTLKPANTYNVKSLVSGKVLTCSFEEGDNVEEGDVLYTVDSSDATTKVEQAGITLQQAQRNYDKTVDRSMCARKWPVS